MEVVGHSDYEKLRRQKLASSQRIRDDAIEDYYDRLRRKHSYVVDNLVVNFKNDPKYYQKKSDRRLNREEIENLVNQKETKKEHFISDEDLIDEEVVESTQSKTLGQLADELEQEIELARAIRESKKNKAKLSFKVEQVSKPFNEANKKPTKAKREGDLEARLRSWFSDNKASFALASLGLLIFVVGMGITLRSLSFNEKISDNSGSNVLPATNENPEQLSAEQNPDEVQPDVGAYEVPGHLPRYLHIPSLNVQARMVEMGVDENGALGAPNNIFDVGWYKDGVLPGTGSGAVLVDGHVSGFTTPGVFSKLKEMKKGDKLQVEMGDGRKFSYLVVKKASIPINELNMTHTLNSVIAGKECLNLITCGGEFDPDAQTYKNRDIVYTVRTN